MGSFSSHTQQDPSQGATLSETTLVSSSPLADSLTEFAGLLGNGEEGQWEGLGQDQALGELGAGMYNPFDSHGEFLE